jgi:hypothetical protein
MRLSQGEVDGLDSSTGSLQCLYGIDPHDAHLDLAMACITFLRLGGFKENNDRTQNKASSSAAEHPTLSDNDVDLDLDQLSKTSFNIQQRLPLSSIVSEGGSTEQKVLSVEGKIKHNSFYAYSATYWTSHLRLAGPDATKKLFGSSIQMPDSSENCLVRRSDL